MTAALHELVPWLRSQLAQDLQSARAMEHPIGGLLSRWSPAHLIADVEAKWQVLDLVELDFNDDGEPIFLGGYGEAYWDVVRLLALKYADRPGYREEWRP